MQFRTLVIFLLAGCLLAWSMFLSVILFVPAPAISGISGLVAFYATAFLVAISTIMLLGLGWRVSIRKRHETLQREVRITFRHSVLLSCFSLIVLFLSSQNWLSLWIFIALLLSLGVLEYLLLLIDEGHRG